MQTKVTLADLGYRDFFESNRQKMKLGNFAVARVIAEHRGAYEVKNAQGEYVAKVTGKQMFTASSREEYPAVGDWLAITEINQEQAVIEGILPRATVLKRKYGEALKARIYRLQVKGIKIKVILYNLSRMISTLSFLVLIEEFYKARFGDAF